MSLAAGINGFILDKNEFIVKTLLLLLNKPDKINSTYTLSKMVSFLRSDYFLVSPAKILLFSNVCGKQPSPSL